jgi:uncharacterized membrane protein
MTPKDRLPRPLHRLLYSLGACGVVFLFTRQLQLNGLLHYMLIWNVFALCYVSLTWWVFFKRNPEQIRQHARVDDGSALFVSFIIVIAAFSSIFTVLLLMLSKASLHASPALYLPVSIGCMLLSWMLVHTTYSIHYAHLYYDDAEGDTSRHAAGLNFPKEKKPDYLDFAYFAFGLGTTFQVSDVEIESRVIRRTANTFVVALTINMIAGLSK